MIIRKKVTTKLLGVPWNKEKDTYCVDMEIKNSTIITKRTILERVASFYDSMGIMAPVLIEGKHLYRLAVDEKKGWDEEVSNELQVKWKKWIYGLKTVEVLRSIASYLEDVTAVILHHLTLCMGEARRFDNAELPRPTAGEKGRQKNINLFLRAYLGNYAS